MDIYLKVEKRYKIEAVKELIHKAYLELLQKKELKGAEYIYDVDPY